MIRRHFGVSYHVEHARKLLRDGLQWSRRKPQKKAKQPNAEAIGQMIVDPIG